jgi:hypothetical protein
MSFSPPKIRGNAADLFGELEGALDKKSASYLSNWVSSSLLDPMQKEIIENSRNEATRNIVFANKALSGVIPYAQWKDGLNDVFRRQDENNSNSALVVEHGIDAVKGIETLDLKKPPRLVPQDLGEYVAIILGVGEISPYAGPRLKHDTDSIERYATRVPRAVTIEALAESLVDTSVSSKFLVVNAICELEEVYNEIRILLAPSDGDAIRINTSLDDVFDVSQLVVRNAMMKLESCFSGALYRAIGKP